MAFVFYSAHTSRESFRSEIAALVEAAERREDRQASSENLPAPFAGLDTTKRVDPLRAAQSELAFDDYDFTCAGHRLQSSRSNDGLAGPPVADSMIHAEAFWPVRGLLRRNATTAGSGADVANDPTRVAFVRSAKEARWTPQARDIARLADLEVGAGVQLSSAEAAGRFRKDTAVRRAYDRRRLFGVSEGQALNPAARSPRNGRGRDAFSWTSDRRRRD